MKYRPVMTQKLLKEFISYNPETGVLKRTHALDRGHNKYEKEFIPRSTTKQGYLQIGLFKKPYLVHRLAFLYMEGRFPREIDHINGNRQDNRWCNLREVTASENRKNMGLSKNNKSGVQGVYYYSRYKKYEVAIQVKGKRIYLGRYTDFNEAVRIRKQAEQKYKFHKNHGERSSWQK